MPQQKLIIVPPHKGFVQVPAYAEQPPGSSPDLRNVMLWDMGQGKVRVSVRPGLALYDNFDYGSGETYTNGISSPTSGGTIGTDGTTTIAVPAGASVAWYSFTINVDAGVSWSVQRWVNTGADELWYQSIAKYTTAGGRVVWRGQSAPGENAYVGGIGPGTLYVGISPNATALPRQLTLRWTAVTTGFPVFLIVLEQAA